MRIFKRIFSLLLVLSFLFTFCISALAANYDAADYSDMETAFADNSGENVSINVTQDIIFDGALSGKEGITYTISTQNDSVLRDAFFAGAGAVEVKTDLTGLNALTAVEDVAVNVTGDINAFDAGVVACDNAAVTVKGDITAAGNGVWAYDNSVVSVTGSIESTGGDGVNANGNAEVSVVGDITGWDDGVSVFGGASAAVTGDIRAEYGVVCGDNPFNAA